ncbi:hypothetical protein LCGC14_1143650, partial [marine sediment metagenome]
MEDFQINGGILPEPLNLTSVDDIAPPRTGDIKGALTGASNAISEGPTAQLFQTEAAAQPAGLLSLLPSKIAQPINFLSNLPTEITGDLFNSAAHISNPNPPQKILTPTEWKDSEFFRPGLTINEGGIAIGAAREKANRFDKEQRNNRILSNMNPGILSKVAVGGGAILGAVLDPITTATLVGGDELLEGLQIIKKARDAVTVTRLRSVAEGAAKGAVAGLAAGTAGAIATFGARKAFDEKENIPDILENVALFSATGAGLRGLGGIFRRALPAETERNAGATALNQIMADKRPEVGPLIKEGFNDQQDRNNLSRLTLEQKEEARAQNTAELG